MCLERGLFTQSEFDDAKAQAIRLFLSSSPSEGGTNADPLYVEDSITSDDTTEEEEEEEEVVNTSELTPALQELLHSEQGSRRDDWISLVSLLLNPTPEVDRPILTRRRFTLLPTNSATRSSPAQRFSTYRPPNSATSFWARSAALRTWRRSSLRIPSRFPRR